MSSRSASVLRSMSGRIPAHAGTSKASRSPPCRSRGRQCDGQWVTTQHHQCNEPPDCPFAVRVGANKLRDVADRCSFGLDLPALGAQGGALGLEVGKGDAFALALARKHLAVLALRLNGVSAVAVRPRLAASSIAESICARRRSRSVTFWAATSTRAARAASCVSIADCAAPRSPTWAAS